MSRARVWIGIVLVTGVAVAAGYAVYARHIAAAEQARAGAVLRGCGLPPLPQVRAVAEAERLCAEEKARQAKAAEEARRKAEEEARRRAEEEAKRKAEEEAKARKAAVKQAAAKAEAPNDPVLTPEEARDLMAKLAAKCGLRNPWPNGWENATRSFVEGYAKLLCEAAAKIQPPDLSKAFGPVEVR